jgi:transposase
MDKRHGNVTVFQDGDTGQILAIVTHRNAAALSAFFIEQGPRWCRCPKVAVSSRSKSYRTAIKVHLGGARQMWTGSMSCPCSSTL